MELPEYVSLGDLIAALSSVDRDRPVRWGFGTPASYRGDYSELAFAPRENTTIGAMLDYARGALDVVFCGYKGGLYRMDRHTTCHVAHYGRSGSDRIGPTLVRYWIGEDPP